MSHPGQFENVTVVCKANVYFDGKVVSHTILTPAGKKTLGLIYPGVYTFNTAAPEKMEIIAGWCRARLGPRDAWATYRQGDSFNVPAKSSFEISVDEGIAEHICTFE